MKKKNTWTFCSKVSFFLSILLSLCFPVVFILFIFVFLICFLFSVVFSDCFFEVFFRFFPWFWSSVRIFVSQNKPAINSWWFGGWKPWRFTTWNHQLCLKATSYQARCTGSPFSIVVAFLDEKLQSGMVTFIGFTTLSQKMWYFVISF